MLTILYTSPKRFPAGPVRSLLNQHVPLYSWTAGEDDDGSEGCAVDYGYRPILVSGRSAQDAVFVEVRHEEGPAPDLPPHAMRIRVSRPATDSEVMVERILALMASTMAFIDKDGVKVRFDGIDRWLGLEECVALCDKVVGGTRMAEAASARSPFDAAPSTLPPAPGADSGMLTSRIANLPYADRPPRERSAILGFDTLVMATTEQAMAQALGQTGLAGLADFGKLPDFFDEKVTPERLPTLAVLFNRFSPPHPSKIFEILNVFDEEGKWEVEADGDELVATGRGGRIRLTIHEDPLPAWMMELALDRSFGATRGEAMARLRGHRCYVAIRPELDCTSASWLDIRQTAKAMMCAFAIIARPQHAQDCYAVGAYNAATMSCFTDDRLDDLVGALSQNEVSIKTFVWHCFPDTSEGKVSMSSSGLLPFIGREVEVLDAPGSLEHVADQLNTIERYLLIEGPVMGDGDTIAAEPDNPLAPAPRRTARRCAAGSGRNVHAEPRARARRAAPDPSDRRLCSARKLWPQDRLTPQAGKATITHLARSRAKGVRAMRRLSVPVALALALAACLKPAPPPAAAPPEVVSGTATVSLATIPAATVAAWTGTWRGGGRTLEVARMGEMLTANGQPLTFVGLGTFTDAAGTAYLFGPDATLRTYTAAGVETRFTR